MQNLSLVQVTLEIEKRKECIGTSPWIPAHPRTWISQKFSLSNTSLMLSFQVTILLFNLVVLTHKTNPTGLQLTQLISNLSLLILSAPIYFLNCFLDLSQLCLYPIEHVLQHLIVLLPALSSIV